MHHAWQAWSYEHHAFSRRTSLNINAPLRLRRPLPGAPNTSEESLQSDASYAPALATVWHTYPPYAEFLTARVPCPQGYKQHAHVLRMAAYDAHTSCKTRYHEPGPFRHN